MNVLIGVAVYVAAAALIVGVLHVATADNDQLEQIPDDDQLWAEFLSSHPEMTP
jgi:hypothetical protein